MPRPSQSANISSQLEVKLKSNELDFYLGFRLTQSWPNLTKHTSITNTTNPDKFPYQDQSNLIKKNTICQNDLTFI